MPPPEDQSGSSVRYKPEDQKALVMGLTMHSRGKTRYNTSGG